MNNNKKQLIPIISIFIIAILGISCNNSNDNKSVTPDYNQLLNGEYIPLSDTNQYSHQAIDTVVYTSIMLRNDVDSIRGDVYYNYIISNKIIKRAKVDKFNADKVWFFGNNQFKYKDNIIIEFILFPFGSNIGNRYYKANYIKKK